MTVCNSCGHNPKRTIRILLAQDWKKRHRILLEVDQGTADELKAYWGNGDEYPPFLVVDGQPVDGKVNAKITDIDEIDFNQ